MKTGLQGTLRLSGVTDFLSCRVYKCRPWLPPSSSLLLFIISPKSCIKPRLLEIPTAAPDCLCIEPSKHQTPHQHRKSLTGGLSKMCHLVEFCCYECRNIISYQHVPCELHYCAVPAREKSQNYTSLCEHCKSNSL
jgi:hypothetical protein